MKNKFLDVAIFVFVALFSFSTSALFLAKSDKTLDPAVKTTTSDSFLLPLKNLDKDQTRKFVLGKALFHGTSNDNRTPDSKDIGPVYNATTCGQCHVNGGTGDPSSTPSLIVKIVNPSNPKNVDEIYGSQVQTNAIPPITPEATISIDKESQVEIKELSLGPLDKTSSPFNLIPPKMIGLGLIESIPDEFFLEKQDPNDKNKDGISGRIGLTIDPTTNQSEISRFGHKASTANIRTQTLHAAFEDLGLSNSEFGTDCTYSISCTKKRELSSEQEEFLTFYSSVIAPPKKRPLTKDSRNGQMLFNSIGCSSCHTPSIKLGKTDLINSEDIYIHPMSDFLLHDLGRDLGESGSIGNANKNEFRTAPLWGLGLSKKVNGSFFLMHDGRARNINEAISLHGGEASDVRDSYQLLTRSQRRDIHAYLMAL